MRRDLGAHGLRKLPVRLIARAFLDASSEALLSSLFVERTRAAYGGPEEEPCASGEQENNA
jgi:hypothetical protein